MAIVMGWASYGLSADAASLLTPIPASAVLVPQNLLKLIHAAEVQEELGIDDKLRVALEDHFAEIDGDWWRARQLPLKQRRQVIEKLEQRLVAWLEDHLPTSAQSRLAELELQSLGTRALARPGLARRLKLSDAQVRGMKELFEATDAAQAKASGTSNAGRESLQTELTRAVEAEAKGIASTLTADQRTALSKWLGAPFDVQSLQRIYPMAPELIDSGSWVDGSAIRLQDLRGQVVLVHFYAFECHNCVANFDHYRRWHRDLAAKGVRVIGIQTPETERERDASAVRLAARQQRFEFPVLIDLESQNWNAWGNTMWPTVYVVDRRGYLRQWWQGELNWQGAQGDRSIEQTVERLLEESP